MLLAGLAACTDDVIELPGTGGNPTEVPEGYYFVLDTDVPQGAAQTRVAYVNDNHSYFEEDDRLGIYTFDAEGNLLEPHNAEYRVLNVTNVETGNIRQVLENVNPDQRVTRGHHYVIYYPYIKDMYLDRLQNLTYGVHSQQQLDEVEHAQLSGTVSGYEVSDLLWDVATDQMTADGTTHYAKIHLGHAMANIILNIGEEYLPATRPEDGYEAYVLNSPRRATGINLTNSLTDAWSYNVNRQSSMTPIRMWNSGLGSSGAQQFRAAIPACQTIPSGTPLLQIATNEGTKQFKLKENLPLRPGKNYVFTVMKQNTDPDAPIVPDVTDDDSWVLDVLDPETGAPVGLLCREYIRYQQDNTTDQHTGTDNGNGSKWINSQAWVFYNLQEDGKTPNLNQGTVLRFIYDIEPLSYEEQAGDYENYQPIAIWPAPHKEMKSYGLFTPKHGFQWGTMNSEGYGGEFTGNAFQTTDPDANPIETQYYMHGGTIIWNGNENKITNFIMPDESITNSQAYKGYIAIEEGKTPYVAYEEKENVKKGIIMEHYLIDTRYNRENHETETERYPLVKIGYNQFWMSKPLDTSYLTDGTRIPCYNKKNETGVTFSVDNGDQIFLSMGYMYPFVQNDENLKEVNGDYVYYDPYNNPGDRPSTSSSYQVCKHYNRAAIEDPRFVPISQESNNYYTMPSKTDLEYMREYFGPRFAAKICTRETVTFDATKTNAGVGTRFTTTRKEAIIEGKTCGNTSHDPQVYCANISGFNIRAIGFYDSDRYKQSFYDVGEAACLILKREPGQNGITLMRFAVYDSFDIGTNVFNEFEDAHSQNEYTYFLATKVFAQVRMFMKYRNQADTGGVSITTSTRSVSGSVPAESRNVYIPIQAID